MNLKIFIPALLVFVCIWVYTNGCRYLGKGCPPKEERCAILIDSTVAAGPDEESKTKIKPELVSDVQSLLDKTHAQFFGKGLDEQVKGLMSTSLSYVFVDDRSTSLTPIYQLPFLSSEPIVYPPDFKSSFEKSSQSLIDALKSQNPFEKSGSHYIESLQAAAAVSDAVLIVGDLAVEEGSVVDGIRLQDPKADMAVECQRLKDRLKPMVSNIKIGLKVEPIVGNGVVIDQNRRILQCWKSALGISENDLSNGMDALAAGTRCFRSILR
jgi:hypothetical protein